MPQFIMPPFERDVPGVYRVRFNTGHFYIGGTVNLKLRFQQWKTRLQKGVRKNLDMLAVYRQCESVEFDIIEVCSEADVKTREDFYIKLFWGVDKFLNKSPSAFSNLGSTQSDLRVKSAIMQPVAKVDDSGNIICRYESISECATLNNLNEKTLKGTFKKLGLTCGGNTYRKISSDGTLIIPPFVPRKKPNRKKGYKISEEARLRMKALNDERKANGIRKANEKPVSQYTMDGVFIKTHPSVSDTAKAIGLKDERRLRKLLNRREGKSIYNFTFKFAS